MVEFAQAQTIRELDRHHRHRGCQPGAHMAIIRSIILLLLLPTLALAEQRQTFKDASGRELGRSVSDARGNTVYFDAMARRTGRSATSNGQTTVFDTMGRRVGSVSRR
jgi:hypothetical protein